MVLRTSFRRNCVGVKAGLLWSSDEALLCSVGCLSLIGLRGMLSDLCPCAHKWCRSKRLRSRLIVESESPLCSSAILVVYYYSSGSKQTLKTGKHFNLIPLILLYSRLQVYSAGMRLKYNLYFPLSSRHLIILWTLKIKHINCSR